MKEVDNVSVAPSEKDSTIADLKEQLRLCLLNSESLRSSLCEAHHRIKNHMQGIVALLNLRLREQGVLNDDDVRKVILHIQGLASLNDVIGHQALNGGGTAVVSARRVVLKLIESLGRGPQGVNIQAEVDDFPHGVKQAASLSLIVNELVSNASRFGNGEISLSLKVSGEKGKLTVTNKGSQFAPEFTPVIGASNGLKLLALVCKSDLESEPIFENVDSESARVSLDVPIAPTERPA